MDLTLFKKHSRYSGTYLSIMTSRGCPFKCSYCCNHLIAKVVGSKIRERSPENVIEEIKSQLSKSKIKFNYINIVDDCFTVHSEGWFNSFVNLYKQIGIPLLIRVIPQYFDENKINLLKSAPIGLASLGIQSGSERINRDIYLRRYSREKLLTIARYLDKCNISAWYDVIIDNPFETDDDLAETIKIVGQLPGTSEIIFYSLTFYKNTKLYDIGKQAGINVDAQLTKNQSNYCTSSREYTLLRLAQFFGEDVALRTMKNKTAKAKVLALSYLINFILWPLRTFYIAFLSQGKNIPRFLRLLQTCSYSYLVKIWFPDRSN